MKIILKILDGLAFLSSPIFLGGLPFLILGLIYPKTGPLFGLVFFLYSFLWLMIWAYADENGGELISYSFNKFRKNKQKLLFNKKCNNSVLYQSLLDKEEELFK